MERKCPRCGSEKIATNIQLMDSIDTWEPDASAEVRVFANPGAFVKKEEHRGSVTIDMCGDCGHGDITVSNFQDLYRAWLKAQRTIAN